MTIKPGLYRHFKGGFAKVVGVGHHTENQEDLVIYYHDSEEFGKDTLWARPLKMFEETVIVEGKKVPRFTFLKNE